MYVGENVGGMKKGKAAMHKNGVLNGVMEGTSGELLFPTREDLTHDKAISQIQKLTNTTTPVEL